MILKKITLLVTIVSLSLVMNATFADSEITKVKVRHDKRYDFSQINKKYTWTEYESKADQSVLAYDKEVDGLVINQINQTLQANGFQQTDVASASFGIDYHIVVEEEGTASTHVSRVSGRNPYTYVNVEGMPSMQNWRKGTLILNIVNLNTGYVIWVGKADALVVDKENRQQLVEQAVSQMLDQFPPR